MLPQSLIDDENICIDFSEIIYKRLQKLREVSDTETIRETLEEYDGYEVLTENTDKEISGEDIF